MLTVSSTKKLQQDISSLKKKSKRIAFVPTMGFLHEGHLRLIELAQKKADHVVVSIFVNPLQFGPKEDFAIYPRDIKSDLKKMAKLSVGHVFLPKQSEIYPENFSTFVEVQGLSDDLCGASRPGHFRGVTTVVLKLFQIVMPDVAIFGKKDYQQYLIIKKMVADLNLPITIIGAPLVRESDGLAMSSRNVRLSLSQRQKALGLSRGLLAVRTCLQTQKSVSLTRLEQILRDQIREDQEVRIDYIAFRHADTLTPLKTFLPRKTLVALAVQVGSVRLIDNILV